MPMKDPLHPGRTVRNTCLDPLELSVTAAAAHLGVAHHTLSRLLNGQAGISPEMAISSMPIKSTSSVMSLHEGYR
jgi:addiction module HigA family antidote